MTRADRLPGTRAASSAGPPWRGLVSLALVATLSGCRLVPSPDYRCGPVCCQEELGCEGDVSLICNEDGTAWIETEVCDPLQGLTCSDELGVCEGSCVADSLGHSHIGCDFYPTVSPRSDGVAEVSFAVTVANAGDDAAAITVTQGDIVVHEQEILAGTAGTIELPWIAEMVGNQGPSSRVVDGAYRLRSTHPVAVQQHNPLDPHGSSDSSLLLPVNIWGRETVVVSAPHWLYNVAPFPGFYVVVAHADDTTVTLRPPPAGVTVAAGGGVQADGSGQITLDQSDAIVVVTASVDSDLTGSWVSADKPVQVIGGHSCAQVPIGFQECDHLEESLLPVEVLASVYALVPPMQGPNDGVAAAQVVRILATEDDTQLFFDPPRDDVSGLALAGDFVELTTITQPIEVVGTKPIMVVQYMVGQHFSDGWGPSMVQAVSPQHFRSDHMFYANPSHVSSYADVIAPTGTSLTVDGVEVGGWTTIAGSGYAAAHVLLETTSDGGHRASADQPFGVSVYGLSPFQNQSGFTAFGYWSPGGLELDE